MTYKHWIRCDYYYEHWHRRQIAPGVFTEPERSSIKVKGCVNMIRQIEVA